MGFQLRNGIKCFHLYTNPPAVRLLPSFFSIYLFFYLEIPIERTEKQRNTHSAVPWNAQPAVKGKGEELGCWDAGMALVAECLPGKGPGCALKQPIEHESPTWQD